MVEINFIEQKKINIVPYLTVAIFLLLLVLSVLLLLSQYSQQQQQLQSIQTELDQNMAEMNQLTSLREIQKQRVTLAEQVVQVEDSLFPTLPLLDLVVELLPANSFYTFYSFSLQDGLAIDIRVEDITDIAGYSNLLEQQSFVENVTISSINRVESETVAYLASLQVRINNEEVGR